MDSIESQIKNLTKDKIKKRTQQEVQVFVEELLKKMSLEEKIGQLWQSTYESDVCTGPKFCSSDTFNDVKEGKVGSFLNVTDIKTAYTLQKLAVENTPNHIPLMFMFDVIHGMKTMFPSPLMMASSYDDELVKKCCEVASYEAAHLGFNVTFSPMLDLVRDARWGRVNESYGEDAYLGKRMARAFVTGYQKDDLSAYDSIGACAKHFIGYGAAEAGRDYARAEIADCTLWEKYLPPFIEAVDSGVLSVMLSFNAVNGVPMTMNEKMVRDVLKNKLKFGGFTISDYTATEELICHKVCQNRYDVAKKSIKGGLDHEMVASTYKEELLNIVRDNPEYIAYIDDAAKRVLKAKVELGLFDDPYKNIYYNPEKYCLTDEAKKVAYDITSKSFVMLKNNGILPLKKDVKIGLFGIYKDNHSLTGPWAATSDININKTIYEGFKDCGFDVFISDDYQDAKKCDVCVLCIGEDEKYVGEGRSKTKLTLDIEQIELIEKINKINSNIVAVLIAGRPLVISDVLDKFSALIVGFFPGLKTADALIDIVSGKISPSGKLTISFAENEGQYPISYDDYPSGRPVMFHGEKGFRYESHYIDASNYPVFTLGDGLSYNNYEYKNIKLSKNELSGKNDKIEVSFDIKNLGKYDSEEIAFMFIESLCSIPIRPTNELKGYKRIHIKAGETKQVKFIVDFDVLCHYDINLKKVVEDGEYLIKTGKNLSNLCINKIKVKDMNL